MIDYPKLASSLRGMALPDFLIHSIQQEYLSQMDLTDEDRAMNLRSRLVQESGFEQALFDAAFGAVVYSTMAVSLIKEVDFDKLLPLLSIQKLNDPDILNLQMEILQEVMNEKSDFYKEMKDPGLPAETIKKRAKQIMVWTQVSST